MSVQPPPRPPAIGDHATMPYESLPELLGELAPYLSEGLAAGDLVLYICDDHTVDQVRAGLLELDAGMTAALGSGQLTLMSSRDAFFPTGSFNVEAALGAFTTALRGAMGNGFRRIRAVCEMTYLLAKVPGIERAGEFERRANSEIFIPYPFLCVCPMNLRRDVDGTWAAIRRSHPTLFAAGLIHANPEYSEAVGV